MKTLLCALAASATLAAAPAFACQPPPDRGPEDVIAEADVIFYGTAISAFWDVENKRLFGEATAMVSTKFDVLEAVKGDVDLRTTIEHPFPLFGNCGVVFGPNQKFLVFATLDDGVLLTDSVYMGFGLDQADRNKLYSLLKVERFFLAPAAPGK